MPGIDRQKLIINIFGNVLEWYDFTVFAFFAPVLGHVFFPMQNHIVVLIKVFGIFAAGFLARPFGGLLFGHFGDKYGRSKVLQLSIFMMTIPTVLIGFLPSYNTIGYFAPILLLLLRITQGVSAGGELMGSTSYVFETAPEGSKGFCGSWVTTSSIAGVFIGSMVATLFHIFFHYDVLLEWGWRIPFYFGSMLGILGIIMRKNMTETNEFIKGKVNDELSKRPLIDALNSEFPMILKIVLINIFVAVGFYVLFVWMPSYLRAFLRENTVEALIINTTMMLTLIVITPCFGYFSDKIGWRKQAITSVVSIMILTYPLFLLITSGRLWCIVIAEFMFVLCMGGVEGVLSAIMADLFSTKVRFSGLAIGYNFSTALFGGTAPLICTYLIHKTGIIMIPAVYLIFAAAVSIPAFLSLKR